MVEYERLTIDLSLVGEYRSLVREEFKHWYEEEWFFLSYEDFRQISDASFLAYLGHLLSCVSEEGLITVPTARKISREHTGEYFREDKFRRAVAFIAEDQWEYL